MKKLFFLFLLLPFSIYAKDLSNISPIRFVNEDFKDALSRAIKTQNNIGEKDWDSPLDNKIYYKNIDYKRVPKVKTYDELMSLFYSIRNDRYIYYRKDSSFSRRLPWLYPVSGCAERAAMSNIKLEAEKARFPKIFAFGNLKMHTSFALGGYVTWWYHTALIVGFADNYYVLDPSVDMYKPMLVDDWFMTISESSKKLKGSVCSGYTYGPFDRCEEYNTKREEVVYDKIQNYLQDEWVNIGHLGLVPNEVLGDNPPWS